jgi:hypothetical protein
MLEWSNILSVEFVNSSGVETSVRLIHEFADVVASYTVPVDNKDLDLIAFEQMGSSMESLRLKEANATVISEYMYDMSKIRQLKIPL